MATLTAAEIEAQKQRQQQWMLSAYKTARASLPQLVGEPAKVCGISERESLHMYTFHVPSIINPVIQIVVQLLIMASLDLSKVRMFYEECGATAKYDWQMDCWVAMKEI